MTLKRVRCTHGFVIAAKVCPWCFEQRLARLEADRKRKKAEYRQARMANGWTLEKAGE